MVFSLLLVKLSAIAGCARSDRHGYQVHHFYVEMLKEEESSFPTCKGVSHYNVQKCWKQVYNTFSIPPKLVGGIYLFFLRITLIYNRILLEFTKESARILLLFFFHHSNWCFDC
jgi:hypothetical protein